MGMGRITSATSVQSINSSLLQKLEEEKSEELEKQVEKNDTDKNGTLNKDEFISMSKKNSKDCENTTKLAETLFDSFDSNKDGEVDQKEIESGRDNLSKNLGDVYSSSGLKAQINAILGTADSTKADSISSAMEGISESLNSTSNKNVQKYLEQAKLSGNPDYSNMLVNSMLNSSGSLLDYM